MAKVSNQRLKLLLLYQVLLQQSDEEHPLTVQQLIDTLAAWDIQAERKSIYADLEALRSMGVDLHSQKGRVPGWYVGERDFQLPELKLLVDAVQSSRFITRRKSDALIRKLEGLSSVHQAKQLQRQVFVDRRVKVMNESIYYNVDKLHTAIAQDHTITFKYFDYNIRKEKVFRREGKRYRVSPYGLIWDSEMYYLVALDALSGQLRHYRVDKMADIVITCLSREGEPENFDMANYAQKHFGMYSGQEVTMTLRFRREMVNVVLDRFGQEVMLIPDGEEHFTVTLPLVMSPQFFGWLFGLDTGVELLSPPQAVEAYRRQLRCVAEQYQKDKSV